MKRKIVFVLVLFVILFGLVAWTPASPISVARSFITQDCVVQASPDLGIVPTDAASTGAVSVNSPVPSCWMAEQLP
jgi:hypothetical protein